MTRRHHPFLPLALACLALAGRSVPAAQHGPAAHEEAKPMNPRMKWGDSDRLGRPFAKDPSVIRFGGRYLLYYSTAPYTKERRPPGLEAEGWAIGIAESRDLVRWTKIGEVLPAHDYERQGLVNGRIILLDGKLHLFYNTYGNGRRDAICHDTTTDGLRFVRNATNPIVRAQGAWNCGRGIDCDVLEHGDKLLLYYATRDPSMKVQMLVVAGADRRSDFGRAAWTQLLDAPVLKPELPWEKRCIEAPSLLTRDGTICLFYGGGYNNDPQQIGCATSTDGLHFTRLFREPLLPNGKPGTWNASESGHPGLFVDDDGQTYMFFQANNDRGHTWYLSWVKIGWGDGVPRIVGH